MRKMMKSLSTCLSPPDCMFKGKCASSMASREIPKFQLTFLSNLLYVQLHSHFIFKEYIIHCYIILSVFPLKCGFSGIEEILFKIAHPLLIYNNRFCMNILRIYCNTVWLLLRKHIKCIGFK